MKKVSFIGSCFSALIVSAFTKADGWGRGGHLAQTRSDAVVDSLVLNRWQAPSAEKLQSFAIRHGDPNNIDKNRRMLAHQTDIARQKFLESAEDTSLFLIDNRNEASQLVYGDEELGRDVKIKLRCAPHYVGNAVSPLSRNQSVANMSSLIAWLNEHFPNSNVVLLPMPRLSLGTAISLYEDYAREMQQSIEMNPNISEMAFAFPYVDLPRELYHHQKGAPYFEDDVYARYRDAIIELIEKPDIDAETLQAKIKGVPALKVNAATVHSFPSVSATSRTHGETPYDNLSENAYWRLAVANRHPLDMDRIWSKRFDISKKTSVATFGSCFAQHIGKKLKSAGFNFVNYEPAPDGLPAHQAATDGYDIYSARYGNIYTPGQLKQLFLRAFGQFIPRENFWEEDGRFYDPFRPTIQPGGFTSASELQADRGTHFEALRRLFSEVDVIVFTFGLTEAWLNRGDGSVYPLCPGTAHGQFDPGHHEFKNYSVIEVYQDFTEFMSLVGKINPSVRYLLTVSPVPLVATASGQHVLAATSHSKSILRAACSMLFNDFANVDYFPSYELISMHPFRAMFYGPNMRTVSSHGVDHVMKHFFVEQGGKAAAEAVDFEDKCDEILLEASRLAYRQDNARKG